MSETDLDSYADRKFSFYPPVVNVDHNEWRYKKGTWSEVLVRNTQQELEFWVPRRYLREINDVGKPVMIVGLTNQLEYSGGTVRPHRERLVEMPSAEPKRSPIRFPGEAPPAPEPEAPSLFRADSPTEKKIGKFIIASLVIFISIAVVGVFLTRSRESGGTISYQTVLQKDLSFTATTTYYEVVSEFGEPDAVRWRSATGERQYQALEYTKLGLTVIMMGPDRKDQRYIGTKDADWRTVHSVPLPEGGTTAALLRSIDRF